MVELLVVHEGIRWAADRNLAHIIMECDSLQGSSFMDLLVDDIHILLRAFMDLQACYMRRTANVAAHGMAKLAVSSSIDFCWYEEPLNSIVEALSDVA
ncbi:unnamed protein product [Malus baccata var. baccata]